MRTQHFLLLGSIALSSPVLAEDTKPASTNSKPGAEVISGADAAKGTPASEEIIRDHPPGKTRVHHTFPPSAKRL